MMINLVSHPVLHLDRYHEDIRSSPSSWQPFTPDYFQIIISLCEIIRQFYIKLSVLIDPASMENSIAPRPDSAAPYGSVNGRRGVARQSAGVPSFSGSISPPVLDGASPRTPIYRKIPAEAPQWSPGLGELIMNADGKFKVSWSSHEGNPIRFLLNPSFRPRDRITPENLFAAAFGWGRDNLRASSRPLATENWRCS